MKLQTLKDQKGFTIVELLIVIVVIGILAAITIVAYTGVQNNARKADAQSMAKEIANKVEIYAAENEGAYPAAINATTNDNLSEKISGKTLNNTNATTAANGPKDGTTTQPVGYVVCTNGTANTGARITYWQYKGTNVGTITQGTCS